MFEYIITQLFNRAGLRHGVDFTVHDQSFYRDLILKGSLGLGESYMAGKWSSPDLVAFIAKLTSSEWLMRLSYWLSWLYPLELLRTIITSIFGQTRSEARVVGQQHYDLSGEMYEQMLGTPMLYSCAYWKNVDDLDSAQLAKMDLLCRKLDLVEGEIVLDIGCGWGDMAIHMAKEYGCRVVGLTISAGQKEFAENRAEQAGVSDKVTFLLQDYRDHVGSYDKIVSIGMLEHVTYSKLTCYFQRVHDMLKPGGLAAIHSITGRTCNAVGDPWISKYIFPNSAIPSYSAWISALRPVPLEVEDIQNLGPDYAKTLHAWAENYDRLCDKPDSRFVRMWNYYLSVCEAQFITRGLNLWQVVLSKNRAERYDAPR